MTMSGTGSVRQVCQFFELTGLDQFIAPSYGAQYADSRKLTEWTKAMKDATMGLPVTIVQSTSDEGRGFSIM